MITLFDCAHYFNFVSFLLNQRRLKGLSAQCVCVCVRPFKKS